MSDRSAVESAAADWIARKDRDCWSEEDERGLDTWLASDTAHRVAYLRLHAAWSQADRLRALSPPLAPAFGRRALMLQSRMLPIAAGIGGLMLVAAALVFGLSGQLSQKVYATQVGGRETVRLADGSQLMLNTDSRLRASVTATSRTVRLDRGEAFFEVQHDQAHPFVVLVGDRRITDLGTKFSVRRDGGKVWVVVSEGKVRIDTIGPKAAPASGSPPTIVAGGGVAIALAQQVLVVHQNDVQVARTLAWRDGLLNFNQTTLSDAADEFNRYNDKKLVIVGPAAASIRIDGAFRTDNVETFARLLRDGFGLKVEDDGAAIHISQ